MQSVEGPEITDKGSRTSGRVFGQVQLPQTIQEEVWNQPPGMEAERIQGYLPVNLSQAGLLT